MSRIGNQPIVLPAGVTVVVKDRLVTVTGSKGELRYEVHPVIAVQADDTQITCSVKKAGKRSAALWGTTRARLANIVTGVTEGWRKQLELRGVGYKAKLVGNDLELAVGYSHLVTIEAPEGISFTVEKEIITVEGIDIVVVGQVAADVRAVRKPEPYKGKGIRYVDERVRRKVGKVVAAAA